MPLREPFLLRDTRCTVSDRLHEKCSCICPAQPAKLRDAGFHQMPEKVTVDLAPWQIPVVHINVADEVSYQCSSNIYRGCNA